MSHRLQPQDIGYTSQQNFIECAQIMEAAAEYQESILPKAESKLEEHCIMQARDDLLSKARAFRGLAE